MGRFRDVELDELELSGPRLTLRRWRADDAEPVYAIMQDPAMHDFLALPRPYTRAVATRFVSDIGHEGRGQGTGIGCAVAETLTGQLIGSAALRLGSDGELGYWIAPAARGRGYAAEASSVLAAWAFAHGVERVRLLCDVRNLASAHTALAAGFQFEGVVRGGLRSLGKDRAANPGTARRTDLALFARLACDPGNRIPAAFPPLPAYGLTDGVLALRTIAAGDADSLAETDDELTVRWGFTGRTHGYPEVARSAEQAGLQWLVGNLAAFALVDVATGRVAGSLRLRQAGPPQIGGIGYVVHPDFRSRGYAARALRLVVPWAFDVAEFARLELGAKIANEASQRVALAAGFKPDGVRRARLRNPDGTFSDEARFALVNPRYA